MKESLRRSPSRQEVHELAEELAILVAAVEPPELTKHVADCLAQLEILAACDCCTRDAQHAFQLGQALLEVCNQQLGDTRRAIVA
jgi:hypothetical protein